MLRVSKNDVWDGRIDTSEDPTLPRVDPATHKLYREKPWGTRRVGTNLILDGQSGWDTKLSLGKAVASVVTSMDKTSVRALAQANVFYINTNRKMEFVGVPQKFLPGATDELIELADLVTEMKNIRHPFDQGMPARRGIEY